MCRRVVGVVGVAGRVGVTGAVVGVVGIVHGIYLRLVSLEVSSDTQHALDGAQPPVVVLGL